MFGFFKRKKKQEQEATREEHDLQDETAPPADEGEGSAEGKRDGEPEGRAEPPHAETAEESLDENDVADSAAARQPEPEVEVAPDAGGDQATGVAPEVPGAAGCRRA